MVMNKKITADQLEIAKKQITVMEARSEIHQIRTAAMKRKLDEAKVKFDEQETKEKEEKTEKEEKAKNMKKKPAPPEDSSSEDGSDSSSSSSSSSTCIACDEIKAGKKQKGAHKPGCKRRRRAIGGGGSKKQWSSRFGAFWPKQEKGRCSVVLLKDPDPYP